MPMADRSPANTAPNERAARGGRGDHSQAITLPPVIYAGFFAAGIVLDALWPAAVFPTAVQYAVGAGLLALGTAIAAPTLLAFRRHRTTLHVHQSTTALITDGPFRWSRNPAYLTLTLFYLSAAVMVDSLWVVALSAPAVLVLTYGVIVREERYLERTFGDAYRRYRARVRRWL